MTTITHRICLTFAAWSVLAAVPVAAHDLQQATSDWTSVRRALGQSVTVTTRSAEAVDGVLAVVDQSRVVLAVPGLIASGPEWKKLLVMAELRWDAVERGTERVSGRGEREITRDGLFQRGQKVAAWTSIAREQIASINATERKRGSAAGIAIGAAAGGGGGIAMYMLGVRLNNETGGGTELQGIGLILPIVGAAIGYYASSHEERFVYRAASSPALVLDDATWRRIRTSLPPSLRGVAHE